MAGYEPTAAQKIENINAGRDANDNGTKSPNVEGGVSKPLPATVSQPAPAKPNHPDYEALSQAKKDRYIKGGYNPVTPGSEGQSMLDVMHGR